MLINPGLVVLLLGGVIASVLAFKANDRNVDPENRIGCGICAVIVAAITIASSVACLAESKLIDCSKIIQLKQCPDVSTQYDAMIKDNH